MQLGNRLLVIGAVVGSLSLVFRWLPWNVSAALVFAVVFLRFASALGIGDKVVQDVILGVFVSNLNTKSEIARSIIAMEKELPLKLQEFSNEFPDYLSDGLEERADSRQEQRRFVRSEMWSLRLLIWRKRLVHLVVRRERTVRW